MVVTDTTRARDVAHDLTGPEASQRVETISVNGNDRALLTILEAGQVLGVGRSTIYELMAGPQPALRCTHIGRALRIPASSIRAYLEAQTA